MFYRIGVGSPMFPKLRSPETNHCCVVGLYSIWNVVCCMLCVGVGGCYYIPLFYYPILHSSCMGRLYTHTHTPVYAKTSTHIIIHTHLCLSTATYLSNAHRFVSNHMSVCTCTRRKRKLRSCWAPSAISRSPAPPANQRHCA